MSRNTNKALFLSGDRDKTAEGHSRRMLRRSNVTATTNFSHLYLPGQNKACLASSLISKESNTLPNRRGKLNVSTLAGQKKTSTKHTSRTENQQRGEAWVLGSY